MTTKNAVIIAFAVGGILGFIARGFFERVPEEEKDIDEEEVEEIYLDDETDTIVTVHDTIEDEEDTRRKWEKDIMSMEMESHPIVNPITGEEEETITPEMALHELINGNEEYRRDYSSESFIIGEGENAHEFVWDQGPFDEDIIYADVYVNGMSMTSEGCRLGEQEMNLLFGDFTDVIFSENGDGHKELWLTDMDGVNEGCGYHFIYSDIIERE